MRILTIATGIMMMLTSVWCFAVPGAVYAAIAFILGSVMVFAGLSGAFAYFFAHERSVGAPWILAESILTFLLGCLVLMNQLAIDAVIPMFFGMWVLFSGVLRIMASFALRKAENRLWILVLVFGLLSTVVGIYAFFNPAMAALAIVLLIGIFFLMQGVNVLTFGIAMPGKKIMKKKSRAS